MGKKARKTPGASPGAGSGKPKHSLDSNRASKAERGKRDAATVGGPTPDASPTRRAPQQPAR
jgi:hypothetical protein